MRREADDREPSWSGEQMGFDRVAGHFNSLGIAEGGLFMGRWNRYDMILWPRSRTGFCVPAGMIASRPTRKTLRRIAGPRRRPGGRSRPYQPLTYGFVDRSTPTVVAEPWPGNTL